MSRENHKMIDGKLIQMDKRYSQLKLKQKDKIAEWMYLETKAYYEKYYTIVAQLSRQKSKIFIMN